MGIIDILLILVLAMLGGLLGRMAQAVGDWVDMTIAKMHYYQKQSDVMDQIQALMPMIEKHARELMEDDDFPLPPDPPPKATATNRLIG